MPLPLSFAGPVHPPARLASYTKLSHDSNPEGFMQHDRAPGQGFFLHALCPSPPFPTGPSAPWPAGVGVVARFSHQARSRAQSRNPAIPTGLSS